jgi:hypothetical protein
MKELMRMKAESESGKVYYMSTVRKRFLLGVWLAFTLPFAIGGLYVSDKALLFVSVMTGCILGFVFAITGWWYPRLVIDSKGVALHQIGYTLRTGWDNVEAVLLTRGSEGLVLREPLNSIGAGTQAGFSNISYMGATYYGLTQRELIDQRRFIPIEVFAYWFKHGDLWDRMILHAPQLANQSREPIPPPKAPQSRSNIIQFVGALTAAFVMAGVLIFGSPTAQSFAYRLFNLLMGGALGVYAIANVRSAYRYIREKRYGFTLFWTAWAIIQILFSLLLLTRAARGL